LVYDLGPATIPVKVPTYFRFGQGAPAAGSLKTFIFQEGPRLTGTAEFDQLAVGTPAFRHFVEKLEKAGYTVEPRDFSGCLNETVAAFEAGKQFYYDPATFRVFHLLHENRHFAQLQRLARLGIDPFSPHSQGQGRIRANNSRVPRM
jgi:hypothetical protein